MIRSMYSGIAGLKNFQTKLDVIGNNIANVNTNGFKKGRVTFQEAMNQTIQGASGAGNGRGGKNSLQVGLGSVTATIDSLQSQSSLQTTGRSLDLAINGDGFFVVKGLGGQNLYTRGGNFYLDESGSLVTGDGHRVQQFENGRLQDITINSNAELPAQQTEVLEISGNLSSSVSDPDYTFSQQMKVVDDLGEENIYEVIMERASSNEWNITFKNNAMNELNTSTGRITFDGNTASFAAAGGDLILPRPGGGYSIPAAQINVSNITNNAGQVSAQIKTDGNLVGSIESFSVSSSGEINGVYSNGHVERIGSIGLARFNNPSGLEKAGNNLFQESVNSGIANIGNAESAGGTLSSGALEMSNVDLSEEFTEMITAQRGFQANTRIITTSDQILEELVNLKR
ncbi:flagellar hook-basal body complex protein [Jeotgalibacillus sp. S-D1]|uniref:flagellar hook protein FlgE n=1 Tax=Jeotgalibacillus sp. S-D1 TaxID=2552189 RepID=UPI00105A7CEB|nr:flagellar hook-basal body complex protein [Jeotgalibacillus sp. S-D1]TDL35038.1 flagellar hook-basal body complex protein [Jeotgalibacillus sp. S-D1]